MFRILIMNGLLISLILIWTSAAKEPSVETLMNSSAELPTGPQKSSLIDTNKEILSRKFSCGSEFGGVCIYHKKSCPSSLTSEMPQGKPYCFKKHRCCYTDPTTAAPTTIVPTTIITEDPTTAALTTIVPTTIITEDVTWSDIINACISGNNLKTYEEVTIDVCKHKCVEESGITCNSIEYSYQLQMCSLSDAQSDSDDYMEPCSFDGWFFAEIELNTGPVTSAPTTMAPTNSTTNGPATGAPTTMAPKNTTTNGPATGSPITTAPSNTTTNGVSCSLVWNFEEERPLIMIRDSLVISPPILNISISDDPNRIPEGVKLIFACPGEENVFNHASGVHSKLHGECISNDLFKVCVNNKPEIKKLGDFSCSNPMHPSIIQQEGDSPFKKSCEYLGGSLFKIGYIYGDFRDFKDLETNICFREEDHTTLWTSTNVNRMGISASMEYKDQGLAMKTFYTRKSKHDTMQEVLDKEATSVWNDSNCRNHGGNCVRGGKPCPEHLPYQTSQGEPHCNSFYRCCYTEPCNPATCTHKGQTGSCSLDSSPGTTGVGSQECKKGCQCFIKDNKTLHHFKSLLTQSEFSKLSRGGGGGRGGKCGEKDPCPGNFPDYYVCEECETNDAANTFMKEDPKKPNDNPYYLFANNKDRPIIYDANCRIKDLFQIWTCRQYPGSITWSCNLGGKCKANIIEDKGIFKPVGLSLKCNCPGNFPAYHVCTKPNGDSCIENDDADIFMEFMDNALLKPVDDPYYLYASKTSKGTDIDYSYDWTTTTCKIKEYVQIWTCTKKSINGDWHCTSKGDCTTELTKHKKGVFKPNGKTLECSCHLSLYSKHMCTKHPVHCTTNDDANKFMKMLLPKPKDDLYYLYASKTSKVSENDISYIKIGKNKCKIKEYVQFWTCKKDSNNDWDCTSEGDCTTEMIVVGGYFKPDMNKFKCICKDSIAGTEFRKNYICYNCYSYQSAETFINGLTIKATFGAKRYIFAGKLVDRTTPISYTNIINGALPDGTANWCQIKDRVETWKCEKGATWTCGPGDANQPFPEGRLGFCNVMIEKSSPTVPYSYTPKGLKCLCPNLKFEKKHVCPHCNTEAKALQFVNAEGSKPPTNGEPRTIFKYNKGTSDYTRVKVNKKSSCLYNKPAAVMSWRCESKKYGSKFKNCYSIGYCTNIISKKSDGHFIHQDAICYVDLEHRKWNVADTTSSETCIQLDDIATARDDVGSCIAACTKNGLGSLNNVGGCNAFNFKVGTDCILLDCPESALTTKDGTTKDYAAYYVDFNV